MADPRRFKILSVVEVLIRLSSFVRASASFPSPSAYINTKQCQGAVRPCLFHMHITRLFMGKVARYSDAIAQLFASFSINIGNLKLTLENQGGCLCSEPVKMAVAIWLSCSQEFQMPIVTARLEQHRNSLWGNRNV